MENKKYELPALPYGYKDLEPYISEEQLKIHHLKHHQAYVNAANAIIEKMEKSRKEDSEFDAKAVLKDLSFNVSGLILHSYFWENMRPAKENSAKSGMPDSDLLESIEKEFGSFERFKQEFSKTALTVEGSGWACLCFCRKYNRLLISQIEKHNMNFYADFKILLVLDVFEHAYYLDYKNERAKFIEGFWNIINWDEVSKRLKKT